MYKINMASINQLENSLVDVLEKTVEQFPDRGIFHVESDGKNEEFQSYADLLSSAKKMAHVLYGKGLLPQSRLIIASESSSNFLQIFWGCLLAGVIPVPLAHVRTPRKESMEVQKILSVWKATGAPVAADSHNERTYGILAEALKETRAKILPTEKLIAEADIRGHGKDDFYRPTGNDIAILQFSSGSTGMPKGARLTHRNLITNIMALRNREQAKETDSMVTWLPYFHDFGLFGCHLMPLYAGIPQIKMDSFQFAQRPYLWMQKIHEHKATLTSSTNTGVEHLLSYMQIKGDRLPKVNLSSLKVFTVGAEMISAAACKKLEQELAPMGFAKNIIMPGYGLTETTLVATCHKNGHPIDTFLVDREKLVSEGVVQYENKKTDKTAEFVSVGPTVDSCNIRIVNTKGAKLPPNKVGIVEIQGDNVIAGYQDNPEADANAFHDDWFSSGDIGFVDEEGRLCIVGREKEMLVIRGQNYYPADIEKIALKNHENKFRLVIVCGAYDPTESREKVIVFYVKNKKKLTDDITAQTLLSMNGNVNDLAGFSIDHFIPMTQGNIPRTSSGKVIRKELAASFLAGQYAEKVEYIDVLLREQSKGIDPSMIDHEAMVRETWGTILEIDATHTDPHKNLFKLGGDSIRAMRIQGRLEEIYKAKMESNFCYLFPTIAAQMDYFETRDFSIEPPLNELEAITQKIVAERLEVKTDTVGVTENILKRINTISEMLEIVEEVKKVFAEVKITDEFLKFSTIREMADYLQARVFTDKANETGYEIFPLMHFQETLYFHRKGFVRNEPSGLSCYIFLNAGMKGKLDLELFDKALNYVVSRHPVLRSVIDEEDDRPRMKSLDHVPEVHATLVDISAIPADKQHDHVLQLGLEHNDHRFDLSTWPLFYCELVKLGEDKHVFMMNIDHLLVDGFSYMQVFEELFNTYDRMLLGETWELPEIPMTFGDYVRIEQLRQRTAEYRNALEFQLDIFRNLPPKAVLPSKKNPATLEKVQFDTFYQEIEPELIDGLNAIAMEHQVTLNSVLLAAYFKLMNIWCHQDDLIINMPVFNREQYFAGARKTVASFIDIFPVRLQTHFEEPLLEIAKKAEQFTRKLLEVPVSSIELSRNLFEREGLRATSMSSIIFSNSIGMYTGEVSGMKNITLDTPEFRTGAPGTFIDLVIYDYRVHRNSNDNYYFNWNYIRDIFDRDFIEILATQYRTLLEQTANSRDHKAQISPFTGKGIIPERHHKLMEEINNTKAPIPDDTLHGLIEKNATKTPDATALTFEDKTLTYAEFNARANQVAGVLTGLGVESEDFVALFVSRSLELLPAQLGILKCGAAYLPIDIDYPADRVAYVLEDSQTPVLLTQSQHLAALEPTLGNVKAVVLLDENASPDTIPASLKDKVVMPGAVYCDHPETSMPVTPNALAYMIYTSGSTGKPKGVKVTHRNIVNFLNWVKVEIGINGKERMALLTSYAFDMTLTSNWVPFLTGASLHVLSEEKTKDVNSLLHFLSEQDITFLNVTPSHFSLIANARDYLQDQEIPLREDMRIMQGGELINTQDLNLWLRHYPGHHFINEYGPTETTVASTFFPIPVNKENTVELHTVPIGKPVYNTQIHILNNELKNCMVGVPGELCIGGEGVTNGYHNKPEKDAEAFVPNPYGKAGERIYRTGDVVRMLNDGNIEYLGRNDHQINLRGYRIEAGEIENTMREHTNVTEAVIVPRKDTAESLVLVAFYTGPDGATTTSSLRKHLGKTLPEYMIPIHFEYLEAMPSTPSGKLDKEALPNVTVEAGLIDYDSEKPSTELEIQVAEIWEEVLGITGLGLHSNFWDVGGDSLKAMRLIMRMKKEGFFDFGLKEAFEYQTVGSIVKHMLSRKASDDAESSMVDLTYQQFPVARVFCLPYACGNPTMYRELNGLISADYAVIAANMPGHGRSGEPMTSIQEIATLYAKQLGPLVAEAPLFILGYSFGGHIAYEIARILEQNNTPVAGVITVASPPPGIKEGLQAILNSSDNEIMQRSKEVYEYDFTDMSDEERHNYLKTLKIDTKAMVDFTFTNTLDTPALNITGCDEEEQCIRTKARLWNNAFSHCEFEEINGAHMLIKTHVDDLAKRITSFIDMLTLEKTGEK
ncbi:MAG: amino acid adenylation domain-containing protein [Pseudodesulfovibrio sp.]|nr:amino acid adenylation domain-containing protein [Pseudodesulfovibrio sp.]